VAARATGGENRAARLGGDGIGRGHPLVEQGPDGDLDRILRGHDAVGLEQALDLFRAFRFRALRNLR
jgi:hypothetical protein